MPQRYVPGFQGPAIDDVSKKSIAHVGRVQQRANKHLSFEVPSAFSTPSKQLGLLGPPTASCALGLQPGNLLSSTLIPDVRISQ